MKKFCDKVITCDHHMIFIEHKIKSWGSGNQKSKEIQLHRYDEAIESNEEFHGKNMIEYLLLCQVKHH